MARAPSASAPVTEVPPAPVSREAVEADEPAGEIGITPVGAYRF